MNFMDLFPKLSKLFPGITGLFLQIGMVLVHFYHLFSGNVVINTAFENAHGLEKFANILLMPTQYLCDGKSIQYDGETFNINHRFQYQIHKKLYSPIATTFFTPGTLLGSTLKGLALLNHDVKKRHIALKAHLNSIEVISNLEYYRSLGIDITDWKEGEICTSQGYERRPGDDKNLLADKEALKAIIQLFSEENIPCWVDCGTCIGAYRYGGVIPWDNDVDISILLNDFQNAKNILKKLNPKKFSAQDWSSRDCPGNYIRVYVKESLNHVDIYCYDINTAQKTISHIVAHVNSEFMAEDWKERERREAITVPYEVVFPLKKATFDGIDVPVPNQTARYLQYKYGPNISPTYIYNPQTRAYERDLTHPYWDTPLAH